MHRMDSIETQSLEARPVRFAPPPELVSRTERTRPLDPGTPLKRISLELSRQCNLRCVYCYTSATGAPRTGLTDPEIRAIIDEAVACGARAVSIVAGGESLLRHSILVDDDSCIDYANKQGCYTYLYTNCTLVDASAAEWLKTRDVSVIGKFNSLRDDVQDALAGIAGSARRIKRGVDALLNVGLADAKAPRFALETVICRQNYDEMPEMWRWMRSRSIIPEVELPTMHGRAAENQDSLYFNEDEASEKYRVLFEELLAIDRSEFGYTWVPHPPFAAGSCQLYYSNCYINDRGGVQPCAGVTREYGLLRVGSNGDVGQPLSEIVTSAEFLKLRRINELITGACLTCDQRETCYGCRAAAWHKTGDVFAEDPICWRKDPVASRFRLPLAPMAPTYSPCTSSCGTHAHAGGAS